MERDEKVGADVDQSEDITEEDTEGHSLGVVMAMNELLGGSKAQKRTYRRDKDEEVRPINKSFPRMRDDKRG